MEMNRQLISGKAAIGDSNRISLLESYDQATYYDNIEESKIKRPFKTPQFLVKSKGFCEKSFSCLFFCSPKNTSRDKLKEEELNSYYRLKEIAVLSYNEHNEDHENSLKSLFISGLNVDLTNNLETVEWKTIGFQSNNPRTDFRAGGYLSLLFLNFFVGQNKEEFEKMNYIDCFMTAVAAIRLTFLFKIAFNLLESREEYEYLSKQYKIKPISISSFRAFVKNQVDDDNFIFDLLSKCLITAKNIFLKLYDKEIGIRNTQFLDRAVDDAFRKVIFTVLEE